MENCKIVEFGCILEQGNGGWNFELNKVSWYDKEPKWDLRSWNEDHTVCGKGISISDTALLKLKEYLNEVK